MDFIAGKTVDTLQNCKTKVTNLVLCQATYCIKLDIDTSNKAPCPVLCLGFFGSRHFAFA